MWGALLRPSGPDARCLNFPEPVLMQTLKNLRGALTVGRAMGMFEALESRRMFSALETPQPLGDVFVVDATHPPADLFVAPVTTVLSNGNTVAAWYGQEAWVLGFVYVQMYDVHGQKMGGAVQVNTYAIERHGDAPEITALSDGGFVVLWNVTEAGEYNPTGAFAQRFDSSGQKTGYAFSINEVFRASAFHPKVAALAGGGLVAAWYENGTHRARIFDERGQWVGASFEVVRSEGLGLESAIAPSGDGFVIAWVDGGVKARRYDASGQAIGDVIDVESDETHGWQSKVRIETVADGGFVAMWQESTGVNADAYARRFGVDGQAAGPEFLVGTNSLRGQVPQAVCALSDGGYVLFWTDDFSGSQIALGLRYDAQDRAVGSAFMVGAAGVDVLHLDAAAHEAGGLAVVWSGEQAGKESQRVYQGRFFLTDSNDRPDFTASDLPTLVGNSWPQKLLEWATFNPGAADERRQTPTYVVTNVSNPDLFEVLPEIDAAGTLTYTPAWRGYGTSTFTVVVKDNGGTAHGGMDTSLAQTFSVAFRPVNTGPSFVASNPPAGVEDGGLQTVPGWAVFSPGGEGEEYQTATYEVDQISNPDLFSVAPSVGSDGTLSYVPTPESYGTSKFRVRVKDSGGMVQGGVDTGRYQTFTLTIAQVNDAPTLTVTDVEVNEDVGRVTFATWGKFYAGAAHESSQTPIYRIVSVSNPSLFSSQPQVNRSGSDASLTFSTAENAFGVSTVQVYVDDGGGTSNGGISDSPIQTFTITVNPVNDAPRFNMVYPGTIDEDSGPVVTSLPGGFSAGPSNESDQLNLGYTVTVDKPELFSVLPTVRADGKLTYTTAKDAVGTVRFTYVAKDSGGTERGGVDTYSWSDYLFIRSINDAPWFEAVDPPAVLEDAGAQTVPGWATFNPGAYNETSQESRGYTVVENSNPGLFSEGPKIGYYDGTLTYTPAPDAYGTAVIKVIVKDSGLNSGQYVSKEQTYTITVLSVNDVPTFTAVNPGVIDSDTGAQQIKGWAKVNARPANEAVETIGFTVSEVSESELFDVLPRVSANGDLTFTPRFTAAGTATFKVTLKDSGGTANGGVNASWQMFAITMESVNDLPVIGKVDAGDWHVQGDVVRVTASEVADVDSKVSQVAFYRDDNGNGMAEGGELIGMGTQVGGQWILDVPTAGIALGRVEILAVATDSRDGVSAAISDLFELYRVTEQTGKNNFVQYTDAGGNTVKAAIIGGGTVKAYFQGMGNVDAAKLWVEGSTVKSSVAMSVTRGKGSTTDQTTVGSIEVTGALASISASKVNLTNSLDAQGVVRSVTLHDVEGRVSIGGAATDRITLSFGRMEDISIHSTAGISSLKALDWQDTDGMRDGLEAATLGTLTISGRAENKSTKISRLNGDLEADISLTYASAAGKAAPVVSAITLAGDAAGDWDFHAHKVNAITIKGNAGADAWTSEGGFGTVTINGRVNGLSVESARDIAVFRGGQVTDAQIKAVGLLGTLSVLEYLGGEISAGKVGAISTLGRAGTKTVTALAGDFSADITVGGGAAAATAKSLGTVNIKGSVVGTAVQAVSWNVTGGVGSITISGNAILLRIETFTKEAAGNVGLVNIGGELASSDLYAMGKLGALTLGSAKSAIVQAMTDIASVTIKGQAYGMNVSAEGTIGAVAAVNWFDGSMAGDKITSITLKGKAATQTAKAVAGDFTRSEVYVRGTGVAATALALGNVTVAGTMSDTHVWVKGNAGAVSVGAVRDSRFLVGMVHPQDLPSTVEEFSKPGAKLQGFTVTGKGVADAKTMPSFSNTRVAAGVLVNVSLKLVDMEEEGVNGFAAAARVGTYTRQTGPKPADVIRVSNKTAVGVLESAGGSGGYHLEIVA